MDNLNDAPSPGSGLCYDVRLKHWRLGQLEGKPGSEFHRLDITNQKELRELWELEGQGSKGALLLVR